MNKRTQERFARLWDQGVPLLEIAERLNYSASTLAKMRMQLNLRKRYGADDDEAPPTPEVIRLRCAEVQTAWSAVDKQLRYVGVEHTVETGAYEFR